MKLVEKKNRLIDLQKKNSIAIQCWNHKVEYSNIKTNMKMRSMKKKLNMKKAKKKLQIKKQSKRRSTNEKTFKKKKNKNGSLNM